MNRLARQQAIPGTQKPMSKRWVRLSPSMRFIEVAQPVEDWVDIAGPVDKGIIFGELENALQWIPNDARWEQLAQG
jgi:hypothetical protein